MREDAFVNIFSKIAWDFGLLKNDLVKSVGSKFSTANQNIIITKELEAAPTTLYLMQYLPGGCQANCAFCVQGTSSTREKKSSYLVANQLIRYPLQTIIRFLQNKDLPFKRICIQTVLHYEAMDDLLNLVIELKKNTDIPITADCTPITKDEIIKLHDAGLDRITINYELSTPTLFNKIRGEGRNSPYRWELTTRSLDDALQIFGSSRVLSHLIVGIGETDREALCHIDYLLKKKIVPSLLAFRPLEGTDLAELRRITHARFHSLQIAAFLIRNNLDDLESMKFDEDGSLRSPSITKEQLIDIIYSGRCFTTSGCPSCNRPNYTVDPGERHYTYPKIPSQKQLAIIEHEICKRWHLL